TLPVHPLARLAGPEGVAATQHTRRQTGLHRLPLHRPQRPVARQTEAERPQMARQIQPCAYLAQLGRRLEGADIAAVSDGPTLEQLTVPGKHDATLPVRQLGDLGIRQGVVIQDVEAGHAQQTGQPAQVHVGDEAKFLRSRPAHLSYTIPGRLRAAALPAHPAFTVWYPMKFSRVRADVLAGLTTSFALVPECIAFALVAQVNPLMGLYGAFIICTITALFGGRPGMVSGAAGSMAVVIVALVIEHGAQYLLATVLLSGLLMVLFGVLRLGKLIRMVPHPVMLGFVNGLAIVIALAQLEHFRVDGQWMTGPGLYWMLGLVAATMLIVYLLPRRTKAIPSALAAILTLGAATWFFALPTHTLGDMAPVAGGLPRIALPEIPWTLDTLRIIAPYAVLMALVGLLETLLTLNLTDEITQTRGRTNRECVE